MFASLKQTLTQPDVMSYRIYRDRLLADYGDPRDPVVIMLLEQLALAHLNCGQLLHKASEAGTVECASAYLGATARLMAEFRRTALALPAYREAAQRLDRCTDEASANSGKIASDSELEEGHDAQVSSEPTRNNGSSRRARIIARPIGKEAAGGAG
jgi:hypothetical protein